MTSRHRVLIIGCGHIAGGWDAARDADAPPLTHAGAYAQHPAFRIAACVEPDAARRQACMQRWSVPQGAASVQQLHGRFDVVSICSPTALHAEHLRAALALQPRLIFCEKPLTPRVDESAALVAACRDAGVLLAVAHNRRWDPSVERLATELASGRWGALRSAVGSYNKGVLNNGSHLIDLLQRLLGPLQLLAAGPAAADHGADDPSVSALLRTTQGVPVHLVTGHAEDYALFELQLVTSRACITMEDGGQAWRVRERTPSAHFAGYHVLDAGTREGGQVLHSTRLAVDNLHAVLAGRAALASSGDSALAAQRLCEQIRDAALAAQQPGEEKKRDTALAAQQPSGQYHRAALPALT